MILVAGKIIDFFHDIQRAFIRVCQFRNAVLIILCHQTPHSVTKRSKSFLFCHNKSISVVIIEFRIPIQIDNGCSCHTEHLVESPGAIIYGGIRRLKIKIFNQPLVQKNTPRLCKCLNLIESARDIQAVIHHHTGIPELVPPRSIKIKVRIVHQI